MEDIEGMNDQLVLPRRWKRRRRREPVEAIDVFGGNEVMVLSMDHGYQRWMTRLCVEK